MNFHLSALLLSLSALVFGGTGTAILRVAYNFNITLLTHLYKKKSHVKHEIRDIYSLINPLKQWHFITQSLVILCYSCLIISRSAS